MRKLYGSIALALCIWLSLAGVCLAKQVYLADGGIVECKSFWRKGNDVVVLINRDTMVEFGTNELNMKKTFAGVQKRRHAPKKPQAGAAPAAAMTAAPKGAAAPKPAAPPTAAKPAPSPAAAPKPVSPAPAAQSKPAPAEAAKPAAAPPKVETTPPAAPAPAPAPQPAARSEAAPAPAAPAALSKEELERKRKEATAMMTEALQKNDRELMKKAMELQKSTIQPEEQARSQVIGMKLVLISLVCSMLILISLWVVFNKAGHSGWKSLIPIYNVYILMQISGKPGWWTFLMLIPVVGTIFYLLAMLELAEKFGRGALFGVGLCLLPMFCFPLLAFGGARYEERFAFA